MSTRKMIDFSEKKQKKNKKKNAMHSKIR